MINSQLGLKLGANQLPYTVPIHPILVHFTLGLFITAIAFDLAGILFPLEKPILKFLALRVVREGFFHAGWYNLLAAAIVTFFTVALGLFEIMLANPLANVKSSWGLGVEQTMILHGVGGVLLLMAIVSMTVWRGFQRYYWRRDHPRQVQWSYLCVGILLLGVLYVHGTLGAQMGDEFGIHNTAANLLRQGKNPNLLLR